MRTHPTVLAPLAVALAVGAALGLATSPAAAHGDHGSADEVRSVSAAGPGDTPLTSGNVSHLSAHPSQVGISGCFMETAPLLVTSGTDSVRVWDVSDAAHPTTVGVLPEVLFENEAMNCGERRTADGIVRFVLIGVDLVQASPGDVEHTNVGGGELIVVDVTDPAAPAILSRVPGTTSTHTVACVRPANCRFAYSAGEGDRFSIFDLRRLTRPREVDSDRDEPGVQPFWSPTAGHKWNFDEAGIGTHTGWNGASMWRTDRPRHPRLITTTGLAGKGADPKHPGWNDFILHNAFRPNAKKFKPHSKPSLKHGNVLLATEEDYEQTDCSRAGSFQTWWVKALDGSKGAIVPLDKVELSDLGSFPLPQGAFCSSHWFDFRPGGLVAAGFYGGGTQILDVSKPRHIRSHGYAQWGASEVWDSMWVPVYGPRGRQTGARSNVVYSIDLVRGLDVYAVDVPGDGLGAVPSPGSTRVSSLAERARDSAPPVGLVGGLAALAIVVRRRIRHTRP